MVFLRAASRLAARPALSSSTAALRSSTSRAQSFFHGATAARSFSSSNNRQGKVLLVLYDVR